MPGRARRAGALGFAAWLGTAIASALEPVQVGGEAVQIDVTNAGSLIYNFDNRDTKPNEVSTLANDDWGMLYNRLTLQAAWQNWQIGTRLDGVWFYASPSPTDIALELDRTRPEALTGPARARYFQRKFREASLELSNRYIDWLYPAKYWVRYGTPALEVTAGDFNAQLGRGLVLSVRKIDELSSDTTIRGVRSTYRLAQPGAEVSITALGGALNPLRIDEASGRYLAVGGDVTPSWLGVSEAGMPRAVAYDQRAVDAGFLPPPDPSYAPDRVLGFGLSAGSPDVRLGTQAALLLRQRPLSPDLVRSARRILTASQSLELPDLDDHGAFYVELAVERLEQERAAAQLDPGHALYASLSLNQGPLTLNVEAKHYRRFFPLLGNVDVARAREFSTLQYNAPPTTEAFWIDTEFEGFNTCVTGGRARTDVELARGVFAFGWVGRYHTWAESAANDACDTADANLNRVWDVASGFELTSRAGDRATLTVGARDDHSAEPISDAFGSTTTLFYRENYARYDVALPLFGPTSLLLQGWHRRRHQTLGQADEPWNEGEHVTGVEWAPRFSVAFGFEYSSNPQVPSTYLNGVASYRLSSDSSVSLFVGQRRGSLRCVGGVCRIYPPFEGTRLDVTARF